MFTVTGIASAAGIVAAGVSYDRTGGYGVGLIAATGLFMLAGLSYLGQTRMERTRNE